MLGPCQRPNHGHQSDGLPPQCTALVFCFLEPVQMFANSCQSLQRMRATLPERSHSEASSSVPHDSPQRSAVQTASLQCIDCVTPKILYDTTSHSARSKSHEAHHQQTRTLHLINAVSGL
uniref:Uncharacterized protein n=1 Tax=Knipowitschia caucasica TaxID=637954 RepID=A0AAV2KY35_KNICA